MHIRTVLLSVIFVLALSFVSAGTTFAASYGLMDRVDDGLRMAGMPVNHYSHHSFASGVASGHYTSFDQMVNAMKWHKAHGRWAADVTKFQPMQKTWAFKGTITEVNGSTIEMSGMNMNGVEAWPKFRITPWTRIENGVLLLNASDETRMEVKNELQRGSVVTVWATAGGQALVIKNMAPWGQGDFYGPVDCASCGD